MVNNSEYERSVRAGCKAEAAADRGSTLAYVNDLSRGRVHV